MYLEKRILKYKHIMLILAGIIVFLLIHQFSIHGHELKEQTNGLLRIFKRGLITLVIYFLISLIFGNKIISKKQVENISWIDNNEKSPEAVYVFVNLLIGMVCAIPFLFILK